MKRTFARTIPFAVLLAFAAVTFAYGSSTRRTASQTGDAWIDLRTGRISAAPFSTAQGPVIKGQVVDDVFRPSTEVLFADRAVEDMPQGSVPGWIELATGSVHTDVEGVGRQRPYFRGYVDQSGDFHVFADELTAWQKNASE